MAPISPGRSATRPMPAASMACAPALAACPAFNATAGDRLIGGQLMAISGPLARSAADLRLASHALSAPDPRDPWWSPAHTRPLPPPRRPGPDTRGPENRPRNPCRPQLPPRSNPARPRLARSAHRRSPPFREAMDLQLTLWMAEFALGGTDAIAREADPDATFVHAQLTDSPRPPRSKASCAPCNPAPASPASGALLRRFRRSC